MSTEEFGFMLFGYITAGISSIGLILMSLYHITVWFGDTFKCPKCKMYYRDKSNYTYKQGD